MRERQIEEALVASVRQLGGVAIKLRGPSGVPDRLLLLPYGKVIFAEVKRPDGRLSDLQARWRSRLIGMGFSYAVIRSIDDVARAIGGSDGA